jgi:hypothetical protein
MARVQLITTGLMEERALGTSLQLLFPDHEFICKPHLDGFTSAPLPPTRSNTVRASLNIDKFASTLIGIFDPGNRKDRPRPDFVVAVEDVELCNADDPARITAALRDALDRQLAQWPGGARSLTNLRGSLSDCVSFHLMAPMTEALFFGDENAFIRATAPAPDQPNQFDDAACDVEAFSVVDPHYLGAPVEAPCRWRTADGRQGHPKRYLIYLTDPGTGGRYRESEHGVHALAGLAWRTVTRHPNWTRFARSLLADLVDMLGAPNEEFAAALAEGVTHPRTWPPPRDRVLRNL